VRRRSGCVVDPGVFVEELDDLEARGISTETVRPLRATRT
jgi:adenylosuccinate synthase